jgi:hypothetical protein
MKNKASGLYRNIKEINYQQQKNDIQVGLAQQLGNSLLSVLEFIRGC